MLLKERDKQFFRPLWRRVLALVLLSGWTVYEVTLGGPIWALVFGALSGWWLWTFFFNWEDPGPADE